MNKTSAKLLILFTLTISFFSINSNVSHIESLSQDNIINFNVEYEFPFANSTVIFFDQVSDITGETTTQFVMGSRYLLAGYNAISNEEVWRIQLPQDGPVTFYDIISEQTSSENYPSKFYITLSNGTVMQINKESGILWTKLLKSESDCSNINCSRSISILSNGEDLDNPFKLVLGGDDSTAFFLNSNGSLINNFLLDSPITIIKTMNTYSAFGTNSGQLYIFNSTDSLLWSKALSSSNRVMSIGFTNDTIYANSFNESLIAFNLLNGQPSMSGFLIDKEIFSQDAVYIPENHQSDIYLSFLFGSISKYSYDKNLLWNSQLNANLIMDVSIANVSGSLHSELVATTDIGSVFIINNSNGDIISNVPIFLEQISFLSIRDINNDGFDDIIAGSIYGTVKIILGKDLVPPRFITSITFNLSKSNQLFLQILTNEETSSMVVLETEEGIKTVLQNKTYRLNQTFFISQLESDKKYEIQMTIFDRNNNSNISEKFLVQTNIIVETPWDLYFGVLVAILSVIAISYLLLTFIHRKRYLSLAEKAIKLGDYSKGIKLFFKAKNQEKIIETVKLIMNNPELASKMNEIAQSAELEDYITEIHDLIAQEG